MMRAMTSLLPDAGATRRRLLAALGLLPAAGFAATAGLAHGPSWGEHGMVLFGGRDGLFASRSEERRVGKEC